jgi:hypothetical protein
MLEGDWVEGICHSTGRYRSPKRVKKLGEGETFDFAIVKTKLSGFVTPPVVEILCTKVFALFD